MYTNSSKMDERSHDMLIDDGLFKVREDPYTDTSLLVEREQQQLAAWNATQQDYPQDVCVPQLVATQATTMPNEEALVAGGQVLSYRELNQRANQLANHLLTLGVGPNVLVGMCIERSLDMVVTLLGILKAGGVYVPLDPTYPPERLTFMLNDAQAPVLVTRQHLAKRFADQRVQVVCLDADAAILSEQSIANPSSVVTAADLAYVIYTSGSTGQPKGVQITHSSLLNLVFWHRHAFAVTSSDRATQLASPAFDATGWELWPYLTIGASIYLPDEDTRIAPERLRDWLVRYGITIAFLPTVLAESVMFLEWPSTTALRFLLTGADTLHHYPSPNLPFTLVNNYGPTEATVVATFGPVPPVEHPDMLPSIGRPIANTQIYILDEYLQQLPIGEPGEVYIGGAGLAKGYLNRPDLTSEKFILHPFSHEPGERLYKTGDLARYLTDGQIAFLGRADQQIKIRGYRIEPDEIVSLLNAHPMVQKSIVIAREDTPDAKRLVAYVVQVPGTHLTASSLRETLMKHLPDYMLPTAFVQLETLPLTPNGKVDRAALPIPDAINIIRDEFATVPTTPTEERVAEILTSLLKIDEVGIDDNFFMLGGHSLLGTQIIARVAGTFAVDLALRTLFDAPTVRLLSAEIERLIIAKIDTMSDEEVLRRLQ